MLQLPYLRVRHSVLQLDQLLVNHSWPLLHELAGLFNLRAKFPGVNYELFSPGFKFGGFVLQCFYLFGKVLRIDHGHLSLLKCVYVLHVLRDCDFNLIHILYITGIICGQIVHIYTVNDIYLRHLSVKLFEHSAKTAGEALWCLDARIKLRQDNFLL